MQIIRRGKEMKRWQRPVSSNLTQKEESFQNLVFLGRRPLTKGRKERGLITWIEADFV